MHSIQLTNAALRVFKKLPQNVQDEIKSQVVKLKKNPLAGAPLKGIFRKFRSLHISCGGVSYRVIYRILPKTGTITIFLADKRENIYKRLEEMRL